MILNKQFTLSLVATAFLSMILMVRCTETSPLSDGRFTSNDIDVDSTDLDNEPHFDPLEITYNNKSYRDNIKSVIMHKKDWPLSDPVLLLNSQEILELHFDILNGDMESLQYMIVHCDRHWNKSDLTEMDFLEGFNDNYIDYIKNSFNTLRGFVHYQFELPNENIEITKSGNYCVVVYEEDHPERPVFTKRFMVTENTMSIQPRVKRPSEVMDRNYRQEVDFNLNYAPGSIVDPYRNLYVQVCQNHRFDNTFEGYNPNFIKDDEMIYDYDEENVFDGGNEFRHIDLTTLNLNTQRMAFKSAEKDGYRVELTPDQKRTFKKYLLFQDIDGRYLIKTNDGQDDHLEADYADVHFKLPYHEPLDKGGIFVYGQLSDWEIKPEFQMHYDQANRTYRMNTLLKQGYYNYCYMYVSDTLAQGDISFIEGTHFETENEYIYKVYYRDPGDFYDRLLLYHIEKSNEHH